ncbi:MAG TPA: hypothetical protein VHB27_16480 [Rhodopila sp.]|uniref:hypothetical protein n=1 Tax=Rhodopila sp. TaxID=2480087 RepID=UPI002CEFAB4A|nr:hypothetical protein [Rhodopila sp.]HVY16820.1 hypothetical protein [Rhodopila sp.]
MKFTFRLPIGFVAGLLLGSTGAMAQTAAFSCPKPGTVEQRGSYTSKYTGTSPGDPFVCVGTNSFDKPFGRLFNWYGPIYSKTPNLRQGMLDLISGRQTHVSFTFEEGSTENWTFLRREDVTIAGRAVHAMVFDHERQRFPSSRHPFHGRYTQWLDPVNGLWVKSVLTASDGEIAMEAKPYQDTLITIP